MIATDQRRIRHEEDVVATYTGHDQPDGKGCVSPRCTLDPRHHGPHERRARQTALFALAPSADTILRELSDRRLTQARPLIAGLDARRSSQQEIPW
jgi:hypothetical protein